MLVEVVLKLVDVDWEVDILLLVELIEVLVLWVMLVELEVLEIEVLLD